MVFQNEQVVSKTSYPRRFKSPFFSFNNTSAIATGKFFLFDFHRDNVKSKKYNSFNNISITNLSTGAIIFYPNQDKSQGGIIIAGSESRQFDNRIIPSLASALIENIGAGTIAIGDVRVSTWKDDTEIQQIASRLHEKLFSGEPNPFIKDFSEVLLNLKRKL